MTKNCTTYIKAYLSKEEYDRITEKARQTGLPRSVFIKRVCQGFPVESKVDALAVRELVKVNADMGRLGGLLKMWLTNEDAHENAARSLLSDLMNLKEELAQKIRVL